MLGNLSDEEIDAVLHEGKLGRLGCHADGQTYVVPVSYVFDGKNVYVLSVVGKKVEMMRENPRVCFEVEQITHWTNWKTVIAWGTFRELEGAEAETARERIHRRLTSLIEFEAKLSKAQRPEAPGLADRPTTVFEIQLEQRTGKFERLT